jgi:PAS domain S-box-containing protein
MKPADILEKDPTAPILRRRKNKFTRMVDSLPTGILLLDLHGCIVYANDHAARILRVPAERLIGHSIHHPGWMMCGKTGDPITADPAAFCHIVTMKGAAGSFHFTVQSQDCEPILLEVNAAPFFLESGEVEGIITIIEDITQREALLRSVHQNEELLRSVVTNAPLILWSIDQNGIFTLSEGTILIKLGLSPGEIVGQSIFEVYKDFPEIIESTRRALAGELVVTQSQVGELTFDVRYSPIWDSSGRGVSGVIGVSLDITEQKQAEIQIEKQFRRISALHKIDIAIINNLDITTTLNVLLDEVIDQLAIDAASILLLEPDTQSLHPAAARGFLHCPECRGDRPASGARQKVAEGYAGLSVLFRQKIYIPDLPEQISSWQQNNACWEIEKFVSYIGLPLIAKDQVKGVMELFSRSPIRPNQDWLNFLNILTGQVAIAIDNATLFRELQRSNQNLSLAYDSTLEGWARALELRDKETEGHSQRVLHLTVELATEMGIAEEDIIHIRRGALLHDIGKMGIADSILQKDGPLNDDEWNIMRMHPVYAYNLLSPIPYLDRAMEIPYCHHEHWDGSGYPRGLKGEEIPLAARIFSIIDVWDALNYDRPYRKAWPKDKISAYLREQSGKQFDPAVVEVFLRIVNSR